MATIRSTLINKWAGGLSIFDKTMHDRFGKPNGPISLDRDFMINGYDLINLFSSAHIASLRDL